MIRSEYPPIHASRRMNRIDDTDERRVYCRLCSPLMFTPGSPLYQSSAKMKADRRSPLQDFAGSLVTRVS